MIHPPFTGISHSEHRCFESYLRAPWLADFNEGSLTPCCPCCPQRPLFGLNEQ